MIPDDLLPKVRTKLSIIADSEKGGEACPRADTANLRYRGTEQGGSCHFYGAV